MDVDLGVRIERQPDYTTCGPTSLHAVYRYFGDPIDLETVIAETPKLPGGGTLAVHLAALRRGYLADTWVCNVRHFDPTWFQEPVDLIAKLDARVGEKGLVDDPRYGPAFAAVKEYVALGGRTHWEDLELALLMRTLGQGLPLLTGTNGTYLYQRSRATEEGPDDVRGDSFGHFVVLCGYRDADQSVAVADPLLDDPAHGTKYYRVSVHRLIGAIFLGVGSDDGNLLAIRPPSFTPSRGGGTP